MTKVTFEISDHVAKCAEARGLLNSETVEALLQGKAKACSVDKFFDAAESGQPIKVTFDISDDVAANARSLGLLNSGMVEDLLRNKVRVCAATSFCEAAERIHAHGEPPITEEELVDLCRAARKGEAVNLCVTC